MPPVSLFIYIVTRSQFTLWKWILIEAVSPSGQPQRAQQWFTPRIEVEREETRKRKRQAQKDDATRLKWREQTGRH